MNLAKEIKEIEKGIKNNLISPDEARKLIEEIEFLYRAEDILDWGKYYFPDKFTQPFCDELHCYLIKIATDPYTVTLAPRGHAKTTIKCFLIPIFYALNHPELFIHYLNIQATATKAIAVNISIKNELEINEKLIKDYGLQIGEKWTEKQFVLKNGVIFTALGSGESVRGINYRNKRPDYVVGDDLYDENCIENTKAVDKINRWFWGAIYKAVSIDKKVSIHIQGTAISQKDLMHSLSTNKQWKFKKFQAIENWDTGKLLWEENTMLTINKMKSDREAMGSIIFEREMQNNCRDDATSIIKSAWIQYYDVIPQSEKIVLKIMYVDPAISTKDYSDYTAKVIAYISEFGNAYIVDAFNDHMSFNDNMIHIPQLNAIHMFDEVRIEAISAFQAFTQELRRTTSLPIRELTSVKDKISRLIAVSYKFENYKVYINRSIEESIKQELVTQLINNTPDHDDLRDAIVGCIEDSKREFAFAVV